MTIETPKRGVGRPRARSDAPVGDPRQAILLCASNLFSTIGYAGTTMQDIARAAGLRPSSIYYYFSRKEEVRSCLIEQAMQTPLSVATALASSEGRAAVKLFRLLVYHLEILTAGPYNFWFFLREQPESFGDDDQIDARFSAWKSATRGLIEQAIQAGDFAPIHPEFALDMIQGCMRGAQEAFHLDKPMVPQAVVAFAVRALATDTALFDEIFAEARDAIAESRANRRTSAQAGGTRADDT